jgi:hypothetical protein
MNEDLFELSEKIISSNYIKNSKDEFNKRQKLIKTLLSQKQLPKKGNKINKIKRLG